VTKKIQEAVTFIKASREEAITLANDIVGDSEVHALVIQKGFTASPEPVGYMVVPLAKEWVGLTGDEIDEIYKAHHTQYGECKSVNFGYERDIEAKLKEKNT